jgi:hypothetical protein
MLVVGLAFILMGCLSELGTGERFEAFFDPRHPPGFDHWWDGAYPVTVKCGRLVLTAGVVLSIVGAIDLVL